MNKYLALSAFALAILIAAPAEAGRSAHYSAHYSDCLNRCQRYHTYCNGEVLRQLQQNVKNGEHCDPKGAAEFNLDNCTAATRECEAACFATPPVSHTHHK